MKIFIILLLLQACNLTNNNKPEETSTSDTDKQEEKKPKETSTSVADKQEEKKPKETSTSVADKQEEKKPEKASTSVADKQEEKKPKETSTSVADKQEEKKPEKISSLFEQQKLEKPEEIKNILFKDNDEILPLLTLKSFEQPADKTNIVIKDNNIINTLNNYKNNQPNISVIEASKNNIKISLIFGSILAEKETIVNAANEGLEGGGGIDGIIHNAAKVNGKDLLRQEAIEYKKNKNIKSFPTGSAMVMNSYGLSPGITNIIFTAGPNVSSRKNNITQDDNLKLYSSVFNSILKAHNIKSTTISIPAISSAIYGFDINKACDIYYKAAIDFINQYPDTTIKEIRFIEIGLDKLKIMKEKFDAFFK